MAVLAEPEMLVQRAFDAPQHHGRPDDRAGRVAGADRSVGPSVQAPLDEDQHEVDAEVLSRLEDRNGEAPAGWPA